MTALEEKPQKMESKSPSSEEKIGEKSVQFLLKIIFPIFIVLLLWQFIAMITHDLSLLDVANSFVRLTFEGDVEGRLLIEHTTLSVIRVTIGFIIASMTAVPLGIAIGRYKAADAIFGPVVEIMRPIPPIAWIPLSILIFGRGIIFTDIYFTQIFIIWIGAFFPILLNTVAGVKRTNPVHLNVARTFGATERQILGKIVIPSATPEIFAGFRIGFGIGWMCLVAAEMIGSGLGLGYMVLISQTWGRIGETISGMIVIGIIGFLITYMFLYFEKNTLRWRREVSV